MGETPDPLVLLQAEKVLKERMKAMMDGQSDMFDAMVEQERNIR